MMAFIDGLFEEVQEEPKVVGVCDICGMEIYDYEEYYELPDGQIVCDKADCMFDWQKQYRKVGA